MTDEYAYEIKVHTGTRLNSGTSSNVYIKLIGKYQQIDLCGSLMPKVSIFICTILKPFQHIPKGKYYHNLKRLTGLRFCKLLKDILDIFYGHIFVHCFRTIYGMKVPRGIAKLQHG